MKGAIVESLNAHLQSKYEKNGAIAFIDRDGVINVGSPNYINCIDELVLIEGAAKCIGDLKRSGFVTCIVTNQSAISRGLWDEFRLHEIHNHLQKMLLDIDDDAILDLIITCPHRQIDRCDCRKPMPGMLQIGDAIVRGKMAISELLNVDVKIPESADRVNWWGDKPNSKHKLDLIVGDRKSDLGAGWAFGVRLFQVAPKIGIKQVCKRITDVNDLGDQFQPVR